MSRFMSETVLIVTVLITIVVTFAVLIIDDKMGNKKDKQ